MKPSPFQDAAFGTAPERSRRMCEMVRAQVPGSVQVASILDVGCGDGATLLALAEAFPKARLSGIDPSVPNVTAARRRIAAAAPDVAARVRVDTCRLGDACPGAPFDIVILDSVLHILPGATEAVIADLARLVAPGGLLVHNTPVDTGRNRRVVGVRRVFSKLRGGLTDGLLLGLAKLLHGRQWSTEQLRERVFYAYVVPDRLDGEEVRTALERHGFTCLTATAVPAVSPAQLEHRLSAWQRAPETDPSG